MRIPKYLERGDKIGLTCTARGMTEAELDVAIKLIERHGFKPVLGSTVGKMHHQYGGVDKERINDFQKMMNDQEIKAIWICRGGYGTIRILDQLDFSAFMNHPKWIVGYSDVTVLHAHLNGVLGVASLHATMPINLDKNEEQAIQSLFDALKGKKLEYWFSSLGEKKEENIEGEVIGGNLSILYSLLGTRTVLNTSGKILFIEDLDEYLYHVDRMIIALKRAEKLKNLKALIVGGMTDMNDNNIPFGKSAKEIIIEHTKAYSYPVFFDYPAGHIDDNRTIIMGKKMSLSIGEKGCCSIQ